MNTNASRYGYLYNASFLAAALAWAQGVHEPFVLPGFSAPAAVTAGDDPYEHLRAGYVSSQWGRQYGGAVAGGVAGALVLVGIVFIMFRSRRTHPAADVKGVVVDVEDHTDSAAVHVAVAAPATST